ncbi:hypothetical protein PIB30_064448 [Stylosanthes scabra]|uniref:Beta-galactosidase n=1 Tax=Stylosanthes scabra TaxID=79078 RepID=A0ABU6TLH1_9FABA|nr:hypothetical protein [Stylosanthes scabra]
MNDKCLLQMLDKCCKIIGWVLKKGESQQLPPSVPLLGFTSPSLCSVLLWLTCSLVVEGEASLSYDHKAITIGGERRILLLGAIHYPRSTSEAKNFGPWSFPLPLRLFLFVRAFTFIAALRSNQSNA